MRPFWLCPKSTANIGALPDLSTWSCSNLVQNHHHLVGDVIDILHPINSPQPIAVPVVGQDGGGLFAVYTEALSQGLRIIVGPNRIRLGGPALDARKQGCFVDLEFNDAI